MVADLPLITRISESDNEDRAENRAEFNSMEGTEMPLSKETVKAVTEALTTTLENRKRRDIWDTLQLVGNAVSQTSRIRRRRILKQCNPDIINLADRQDLFKDAAPYFFSEGFEHKMKKRAESLKILHKGQTLGQHFPVCRTCYRQVLAKNGNTSNLLAHLKANHGKVYSEAILTAQYRK